MKKSDIIPVVLMSIVILVTIGLFIYSFFLPDFTETVLLIYVCLVFLFREILLLITILDNTKEINEKSIKDENP